jgi:hypothetical protein
MLHWLLPSPPKQKSNRLAMKGGGFLGVVGGKTEGDREQENKMKTTQAANHSLHQLRERRHNL